MAKDNTALQWTVRKLIAELQLMPQDAEVKIDPGLSHNHQYQHIQLLTKDRRTFGDGKQYVTIVAE